MKPLAITSTQAKTAAPSLKRRLKSDWQDWEATLLVENGLKQSIVDTYFPDTGERSQSFIYGFDLTRSELLLDGLYPFPDWISMQFESGFAPEFWVQLKASEAFFNLLVVIEEIDREMLTVQILDSGLTRNRRWEDRIHFPSQAAPKVEVFSPGIPIQEAQLSNLSVGGAQIMIFGAEAKSFHKKQRQIECRIKFNQDFIFDLKAEIKQCQFIRMPCHHSIIRMQFIQMTAVQRTQLSALISAFHPGSKGCAA